MNPLLLASLANIVGGVAGNALSQGDRDKASSEIASIKDLYANLSVPDIEAMKVASENYNVGPLLGGNIQNETAEQLAGQSALADIELDPRLKQTQMNALDVLSQISGKGFTADELNQLQEQRSSREADLTSKLKALQQNQDMRGVGNSDMALAQKMMESQSSANRGAQDARATQAQGLSRALAAITQGANLASGMENADYNRQSNLASATDSRELTNLGQRARVNSSNVDRFNQALQSDVTRQQSVGDKNVGQRNMDQVNNKNLLQTDFNNKRALAGDRAGVAQGQAQNYTNNANRTAGMFQGIGAGVGQAAMAGGMNSQSNNTGATVDSGKYGIDDIQPLKYGLFSKG